MTNQPARGTGPAMSRRALLAVAPAAAVVPAAALDATPRDPHPEWLAEWRPIRDAINDHPTCEGPDVDALDKRRYHLEDLISATPARTVEGVVAQVTWLVEDGKDFWCCDDHRIAADTILAGLEALA